MSNSFRRVVAVVVLCLPTIAVAGGSSSASCDGVVLTETERAAVREHYAVNREDFDPTELRTLAAGEKSLAERGKGFVPCLVEIFQHGLTQPPWKREASGLNPKRIADGFWAIDLIMQNDRATATMLLENEAHRLTWRDARVLEVVSRLTWLGSTKGREKVLERFTNSFCYDVYGTLGVLSSMNDAFALPAVQKRLADPAPLPSQCSNLKSGLQSLAWQLEKNDSALLGEVQRLGPSSTFQLRCLGNMGKWDLVERVASNPQDDAQGAAKEVLASRNVAPRHSP